MMSFYEFFAGAGMVRAGLGPEWHCLFANDFDHKKGQSYRKNWGVAELKTADVGSLTTKSLPGIADMAWASFPCQDLSVAGGGAGLKGDRSGTFWPFWTLMKSLMKEDRVATADCSGERLWCPHVPRWEGFCDDLRRIPTGGFCRWRHCRGRGPVRAAVQAATVHDRCA